MDAGSESVDRQFGNIRRMLQIQKEEVRSDIEEVAFEIEQRLLAQLDEVFYIKLIQLKQIENEARRNGQDVMDPDVFYRSTALRSLTSLDWLSNPLWRPITVGYLKSCEARPEQLVLVENYSSFSYCVGDNVQVYYKSVIDYDPLLIEFTSAVVQDPTGEVVFPYCKDFGNGLYVVEFPVKKVGRYSVYIKLYSIPIKGNPFFIHVVEKPLVMVPLQGAYSSLCNTMLTAPGPDVPSETCSVQDYIVVTCKDAVMCSNGTDAPVGASFKDAVEYGEQVEMQQQLDVLDVSEMKDQSALKPNCEEHTEFPSDLPQSTVPQWVSDKSQASNDETPNFSSCSSLYLSTKPSEGPDNDSRSGLSVPLTSSPLKDGAVCETLYCSGDTFMGAESLLGQTSLSFHGSSPEPEPGASASNTFKGCVTGQLALEIKRFQKGDLLRFPIGISASRAGNIVIADTGKDRVLIFNSEGTGLQTVTLPRPHVFRRPSAVVCLDNGCFAVKDDYCVYVFSEQGEFVRCLGKMKLYKPYGLAVDNQGMLFTLALSNPPKTWRFNVSGMMESSAIYMPLFPRPPPSSKCRFLDIHKEALFVADLGLSSIYKTDLNGNILCSFGKKGRSNGDFYEPSGISATERCLFIGDSKNNRVQVFDFDGNYKNVVKFSSSVDRPSGIYASADDKLYVLNYLHGVLKVFKLGFE